MTTRVGSLVKAQTSLSLRSVVLRYSSSPARSMPRNRPTASPPAANMSRFGKTGASGRFGASIMRNCSPCWPHSPEDLLPLLALFQGGCHRRFVHLLQQRVVELQSRFMVASDLLVLRLDLRARRNSTLVVADLLFNPTLFMLGVSHRLLRRAKLSLQLLQLRRVRTVEGGRYHSRRRFSRSARDLRLEFGNLVRNLNHVGMVRSVECVQRLPLRD